MLVSGAMAASMLDALVFPGGTSLTGTTLRIRTGARPATCVAAPTGTLLAEAIQLGSWPASTYLTVNAIGIMTAASGLCFSDGSINTTGTAGYWRLEDSFNVCIAQGTLGTSGAELIVNSTAVVAGQTFNVTAFAFYLSGLH